MGNIFFTALAFALATMVAVFLKNIFKKSTSTNKIEALNNPKNVVKNFNIGHKLYKEEKFEEAIGFFNNIDKTINMEYTVSAEYFKGVSYFKLKNYEEAKKSFEYYIHNRLYLNNNDNNITLANAKYYLGGIYFYENNISLAKEYKESAITLYNPIINTNYVNFIGYSEL